MPLGHVSAKATRKTSSCKPCFPRGNARWTRVGLLYRFPLYRAASSPCRWIFALARTFRRRGRPGCVRSGYACATNPSSKPCSRSLEHEEVDFAFAGLHAAANSRAGAEDRKGGLRCRLLLVHGGSLREGTRRRFGRL